MLEVRLLGKFAVSLAGRPIEIPWHPGQLLLAYLLLNVGKVQRREKLAGLLWPDSDEANARNNLRQTLWRLRQALGEDYILADKISVEFNSEANYHLDVDLLLDDTEMSSADELIRIVSAYEGSLLPGFYEDWVVLEQERLQAVFEHKMQVLLNRLVEAQRWSDVLTWGERWIALGQTPEPAYRALMLAHAGLGDRSNVVAVYQRCVKALQQELDVEPSEQTRKLYERLLSPEAPAPEPFPALDGLSGQAVGPYRLVEKIGAGGMAEVYKAYQTRLDRYVAVKFIKPQLLASGNFRVRFEREAKIMAQLNHPHIVHVYDFGETGSHYYLVMEYVNGGTLKDWLKKTHQVGQMMNPDQVVPILRQVGAALDFAHQQGIIHRDLKPSNIMLTPDGGALLADFGLAKLIDGSGDSTKTSLTSGTPAYMSPEQVESDPAKMGPASDLYSLGIILYELVTGQLPFTADSSVALMFKHVNEVVPLPRSLNPDLSEVLEQVLLKALAKEPAERYQRAGDLTEAFATALLSATRPAPSPSVRPNPHLMKLPLQSPPFIGREKELADITRRLKDPACRLLTLIGPGGIGKTRLAIQAVQTLINTPFAEATFGHAILFVPLTAISSPSGMVSAIAEAANFTFYSNVPPKQQLLDYLREKEMLLVLDNFEHLLSSPERENAGGVDLIAEILAVAPAVKLLVTSREGLNMQEEWLYPLQGLNLPAGDRAETGSALDEYSAIRLFVQSARRVQPNFSLAAEAEEVLRICRLVEGMPLGIELAAAWLKVLPCAKIAAEIEGSLDFLSSSLRNVPARHRSMRAVFEQSWQRLSEPEQAVLRQLSVFRGGFRRKAAVAVAGASLSALAGLVDKSLISLTPGGRYHLHELLRQFSADKLDEAPPQPAATRERHSAYFLAFLQEREAGLKGKQLKAVLDEIQAEIENVRAGWNWAIEQGQVEAIDHALDSLYQFYWRRSHFHEGEEAFRRAAEHLQALELHSSTLKRMPIEKVFMKALARQGAFCTALGRYDLAEDLLQNSLELARRWEAQAEIAFCLNFLGDAVWRQQGDLIKAEQLYRESLTISQAVGHHLGMAETLERLGWMASDKGDYLTAKSYLQQGLDLLRDIENQSGMAMLLDKLGVNAWCLGEYTESEQYYQESLALSREIGDRLGMAHAVGGLGLVAFGEARLNEAKQLMEESLTIFREIGHQFQVQSSLTALGGVSNSMGRYKEAQRYLQEAWDLTKQFGHKASPSWILNGLGEATLGLGNFQVARNYLLEVLETASLIPQTLQALMNWAALLKKEADLPAAGVIYDQEALANNEQKKQAVTILSLVINHPATAQDDKDKAVRLLAELEAELPPEVFAAARARGKSRKLEEVVVEILREAGNDTLTPDKTAQYSGH